MRRVGGRIVAGAAGLALIAATSWWWDLSGPVPILQALYPAVAVGAVLLLVLAALVRHRAAALVALAAVVVAAVAVVPTLLPASTAAAAAGSLAPNGAGTAAQAAPGGARSPGAADGAGQSVRVFALNTQFGMADLGRIREVVTDRAIDVLILTEADPEYTPHAARTVADLLPHTSGEATLGGAAGTIVLSRYPMTVLDRDAADPTKHQQPIVRLDVHGTDVLVRGVHPRSPTEDKIASWRPDLLGLADWQRGTTGPLIVAGDFNAGWPHPAFRTLADGLDDALRATGQAWAPTWPVSRRTPAFTQIDHVLTRGFQVRAAGTEQVPGTDHRGVWAELTLR